MPRIARTEILSRLRTKIARGQPIVGGGAGTGLSAKCEEAGGIDLIVIYNSGRYRMAGRGSLAGLLAYGNANEIVCEMAHEVLPVYRQLPRPSNRLLRRRLLPSRPMPPRPSGPRPTGLESKRRRRAAGCCRSACPPGLLRPLRWLLSWWSWSACCWRRT